MEDNAARFEVGWNMMQNNAELALQDLPGTEQFSMKSCARCASLLVSEWFYGLHNTDEHHVKSIRVLAYARSRGQTDPLETRGCGRRPAPSI